MTLQELINQGRLEVISGISADQIKKRFEGAMRYFNAAKNLFENQGDSNDSNVVVYTNLYNTARITGEVLLLMNGYRAGISRHHETVMLAANLILDKPETKNTLKRLDKMRKNRNAMEYDIDILDVSKDTLIQSMKDVLKFTKAVEGLIDGKDSQKKLL